MKEFIVRLWVDVVIKAESSGEAMAAAKSNTRVPCTVGGEAEVYDIQVADIRERR